MNCLFGFLLVLHTGTIFKRKLIRRDYYLHLAVRINSSFCDGIDSFIVFFLPHQCV